MLDLLWKEKRHFKLRSPLVDLDAATKTTLASYATLLAHEVLNYTAHVRQQLRK